MSEKQQLETIDESYPNEDVEVYVKDQPIVGTHQLSKTADTLGEFNRVLWELAKAVFIITAMLLGVSMVIIAYYGVSILMGL